MDDYAEVYRDAAGDFRWRYKSANGNTLADSAEGYKNRDDMLDMLAKVTQRAPVMVETKSADLPVSAVVQIRVVIVSG